MSICIGCGLEVDVGTGLLQVNLNPNGGLGCDANGLAVVEGCGINVGASVSADVCVNGGLACGATTEDADCLYVDVQGQGAGASVALATAQNGASPNCNGLVRTSSGMWAPPKVCASVAAGAANHDFSGMGLIASLVGSVDGVSIPGYSILGRPMSVLVPNTDPCKPMVISLAFSAGIPNVLYSRCEVWNWRIVTSFVLASGPDVFTPRDQIFWDTRHFPTVAVAGCAGDERVEYEPGSLVTHSGGVVPVGDALRARVLLVANRTVGPGPDTTTVLSPFDLRIDGLGVSSPCGSLISGTTP